MSELVAIPFEQESTKIKEKVKDYWTNRAEGFLDLREAELSSEKADRWIEEILSNFPEGKPLKILDVGCGSGFFEVLLGSVGHEITGVDLTPEMIEKSKQLIQLHQLDERYVTVQVMDAEKLEFADETFDVVISRNLTWTLPHPMEAYKEWKRVLKSGGMLLNFDAEYAKGAHKYKLPENHAHDMISDKLKEDCHTIYHMLSMSTMDRPKWDVQVLEHLGFYDVEIDISVGDRIYAEQDQFYIPDHMFGIKAIK